MTGIDDLAAIAMSPEGKPQEAPSAFTRTAPAPLGVFGAAPASSALLEAPGSPMAAETQPVKFQLGGLADEAVKLDRIETEIALRRAKDVDPERYAIASKIAADRGVSADLVFRNLDQFENAKAADEIRSVLAQSPALADWFKRDDNSRLIKFDEMQQMATLPWIVWSAGNAFRDGMTDVSIADAVLRQRDHGDTSSELEQSIQDMESRQRKTYGADGFFSQGWETLWRSIPAMIDSFSEGSKAGAATAAGFAGVALLAGQAGPQVATPEEIITVPAAAISGFGVGTTYGMWKRNADVMGALAYRDFAKIKTEDGRPIDPNLAAWASRLVGVVSGGLELIGFEKTIGQVPGMDKVLGNFTQEGMRQALLRPTFRQALQNFISNSAKGGAAEITTEALQQLFQDLAQEGAKAVDGGEFQFMTPGEIAGRTADAAVAAAGAMVFMMPLVSGSRLGHDMAAAGRASRNQKVFLALQDNATGNKMRERLPEKYKEAVTSILKDGPVDTVYIPAEKAQELFQSGTIDLGDFDEVADLGARFREGIETGGDIAIPLGDYATYIAGTPAGAALAEHAKFRPDDMSSAEAVEFQEAWRSATEAGLKQLQDDVKALQSDKPGDLVYQDVRTKILQAGKTPEEANSLATLYREFMTTMGAKTGVDPLELYKRYGFSVEQSILSSPAYQETGSIDLILNKLRTKSGLKIAQRRALKSRGDSLVEFLIKRGGIREMAGELKARDLDKIAGLVKEAVDAGQVDMDGVARVIDNTLDEATRAAWEAGYFQDRGFPAPRDQTGTYERPTPDALLEALTDEIGGKPVYSGNAQIDQNAEQILYWSGILDRLGVDPTQMTNEQIKAALEAGFNEKSQADFLADLDPSVRPLYQHTIQALEGRTLNQREALPGMKEKKKVIRGSIRLKSGASTITLFENADLSTFLHETGHFFLEVFRDLATRADLEQDRFIPLDRAGTFAGYTAPDANGMKRRRAAVSVRGQLFEAHDHQSAIEKAVQALGPEVAAEIDANPENIIGFIKADNPLSDDWSVIKKEFGIDDENVISEAAHERWAKSFEAFMFEGNAPSIELQSPFAKFRSWLTFVYQTITRLGITLSDNARDVMGRMLATDEQIEALKSETDFKPAIIDPVAVAMEPGAFADYQRLVEEAADEAKARLDARVINEISREQKRVWKEEKARVRDDVWSELARNKTYQAIHFFRTGKMLEDDGRGEIPDPMKLDRDVIVQMMGEGALGQLPRGVPPIYAKYGKGKNVVHPDIAAQIFGFDSGSQMLTEMMSIPSMSKVLAAKVSEIMTERHGSILADQAAVVREAMEAFHNDKRASVLEVEINALAKRGGNGELTPRRFARQIAESVMGAKKAKDATRAQMYMQAERKAAAKAEKLIIAGEWEDAAAAKRQQLFNHYLATSAIQAKRDLEQMEGYFGRFTGNKRPGAVDPDYLDQIEALLERYEWDRVSLRKLQRRQNLADFIAEQEAAGNVVTIPPELRDETKRINYRNLTMDDLRSLRDAVKNLEHLGKLKRKLIVKGKEMDFADAKADLMTAAEMNLKAKTRKSLDRNKGKVERLGDFFAGLDASLLKIEQVVEWIDGGDINGPARRLIFQPIADAEGRANDLTVQYTEKVDKIIRTLDRDRLQETIFVPTVNTNFQRHEIIAVALNTGNESNLDKMLRGEKWQQGQVDAILEHLNADEWRAVQDIWNTIEELWPQIAALERRLTGVEPVKVEPRQFQNQHGDFQGGYYPLIYDADKSLDVFQRDEARADKMFENSYVRPSTDHGHAKARSEGYARPIKFTLDGLGGHLQKVIHDLSYREAVRDVYKLVSDQEVSARLIERLGRPIYLQFTPWLQAIANDKVDARGVGSWEGVMRKARMNTTIMGLGFRWTTVAAQINGLMASAEFMGGASAFAGLKQFVTSPIGSTRAALSLSAEMRHRHNQMDRDVRAGLRAIQNDEGIVADARRFAYYGIAMMDRVVSVAAWSGAYHKHLKENPNDQSGAIAYADRAVRLSQGSGSQKDLSAIQRGGEGMKWITMFYSYFNVMYNRQRDIGRAVGRGDYAHALARSVYLMVFPAILGEFLTGKGPEDDEDKAAWTIKKIAMYPFMSVPVVRDIVTGIGSDFDAQTTPIARLFQTVSRFGKDIVDASQGDADARQFVKHAIETVGFAAGLPLGQATTTIDNVWRGLEEGDFQLRDLLLKRDK